jgi:hypothetical protein
MEQNMILLSIVLSLHAAATFMMTGLIWFVQLVHYPLMGVVGETGFVVYEREHTRRTTWIVAPLMGVEALTAVALVVLAETRAMQLLTTIGLILLLAIWASTAWLQVPSHRRLAKGLDAGAVSRLVATNWIRTFAWTGRAGIAAALPLLAA